ncbi:hypothetical protein ACN28S_27260 [Cystobacter fuscus]
MRTSRSGPVRTAIGTSHAPTPSTSPPAAASPWRRGVRSASPNRAGRNEGRAPRANPTTAPASTAWRRERSERRTAQAPSTRRASPVPSEPGVAPKRTGSGSRARRAVAVRAPAAPRNGHATSPNTPRQTAPSTMPGTQRAPTSEAPAAEAGRARATYTG